MSERPRSVSALALRLAGWEYEGPVPTVKKFVALGVPHTSNWDGVLLLAVARRIGLDLAWMIKDDWLRGPMGPVLRATGAVPVNRKGAHNLVQQMIDEFARRDAFALLIPPEGTRKRAEHWKSGFYHIALGAGVPVVPGYLDYGRKRAGLGPPLTMTGDVRADMDRLRAYYAEKRPTPQNPAGFGPIRLREEAEAEAGPRPV